VNSDVNSHVAGSSAVQTPDSASNAPNLLARLDARAKVIGFVVFAVLVVTTPPEAGWAFMLYGLTLVFVAALGRLSPSALAKRLLVVVPFVLVVAVFLPFFHQEGRALLEWGPLRVTDRGLLVFWNAAAKAVLATLGMIMLGLTTPFEELVSGLGQLHVPRVFVLTLGFMHRYGRLFVEESRRMQRAMQSRNYEPRWLGQVPALGRMLGSLFVRSYSRGERVYVAMVSRGYEGTFRLEQSRRFGLLDVTFLVGLLGAAAAIRTVAALGGLP
jgi:cobalt/nickel transport system permease protein